MQYYIKYFKKKKFHTNLQRSFSVTISRIESSGSMRSAGKPAGLEDNKGHVGFMVVSVASWRALAAIRSSSEAVLGRGTLGLGDREPEITPSRSSLLECLISIAPYLPVVVVIVAPNHYILDFSTTRLDGRPLFLRPRCHDLDNPKEPTTIQSLLLPFGLASSYYLLFDSLENHDPLIFISEIFSLFRSSFSTSSHLRVPFPLPRTRLPIPSSFATNQNSYRLLRSSSSLDISQRTISL